MDWRLGPAVAAVLLAGCTIGPFEPSATEAPTLETVRGALDSTYVLRGNTTIMTYFFNLTTAGSVSAAWAVEDGGVGTACVFTPEAFEDWTTKANPHLNHEAICDAGKERGGVTGTLAPGAYVLMVAGYKCPALDCRLQARVDAPSNSGGVFGIDGDDPWLRT